MVALCHLASHWLLLLLLVPALAVATFAVAVAVATIDRVSELYEARVKEPLEEAEFAFLFLGSLYFVLPLFVFTLIDDWAEIFFDCFTPISLWLDALYSADVIAFHILIIGLTHNSFGKVLIEYGGLALGLVAVFVYVMLKVGDKKYIISEDRNKVLTHSEARTYNIRVLSFFMVAVFAAIIQLQFRFPFPENYSRIATTLGFFGIFFQIGQIGQSFYYRWAKGKDGFKNDAPQIRKLKITATLIKIMTLSYEVWAQIAQGYRQSVLRKPLCDMTIAALIVNCVLFTARYIGPQTMKDYFVPSSPPPETRQQYFARTLALLHENDFFGVVQRADEKSQDE